MRYKLVKLERLSGKRASIYSIVQDDETDSYLDKFIQDHRDSFINEINDIVRRLRSIGQKTGAREQFFKTYEGCPGDGVCALYDEQESKLRLYCIRYGTQLVVVGNGGPKPKSIRTFQEDDTLTEENYFLRWLSEEITGRIREKEIIYINDDLDFSGNLEFQDDERI